jgi:hypothetical protein
VSAEYFGIAITTAGPIRDAMLPIPYSMQDLQVWDNHLPGSDYLPGKLLHHWLTVVSLNIEGGANAKKVGRAKATPDL